MKDTLEAVVATVRKAAPGTAEAEKWNSPSFFVKRTGQFFATVSIHGKPGKQSVLVVLHQGAKTTKAAKTGVAIDDPKGILVWPSKDRAVARFVDVKDAKAKAPALRAIVRQWIEAL